MSEINEDLLRKVLSLPIDLRTKLFDKLIESLNIPVQKNVDELWGHEAEKRISDIDSGRVKAVAGVYFFRKYVKGIRNEL